MKRAKSIITILSTALLVIGIVVSSFLTEYSSVIASVVTTVTAVIGAIALYIQFKKDKEINQASFIIEFHKTFNDNEDIKEVYLILNRKDNGDKVSLKDKYEKVIEYLTWIRTLCSFIEQGTLNFDTIDEIFGFKFFAALNDKEIQDMEIVKYYQYYKLIYKTYNKWEEYRKKHNKTIPSAKTALSSTKHYDEMVNKSASKKK